MACDMGSLWPVVKLLGNYVACDLVLLGSLCGPVALCHFSWGGGGGGA